MISRHSTLMRRVPTVAPAATLSTSNIQFAQRQSIASITEFCSRAMCAIGDLSASACSGTCRNPWLPDVKRMISKMVKTLDVKMKGVRK